MNIEGYEFDLIPYMLETGIMKKINYFICQFHLFENDLQPYYDLRAKVGHGKHLRFDYGPTRS